MVEDCPTCGRQFDSSRGLRVHHAATHDETLPNRECAACDTAFYTPHEQKYCSEECRERSVSFQGEDNPNYRGGTTETSCEICGTSFEFYPSEKPGRYCPECVENERWRHRPNATGPANPRWVGGKRTVECDVCGASVRRYPSELTGEIVACSRECQSEWLSETFTGEAHPNWAGGGVGPYGRGWREARRRTLERDGHACVLCGVTREELGRNPDVHHVVPVRAFLETPVTAVADAHYPANLVSLCPSCHRRAEFGAVSRSELRDRVGAH